MFRSSSNKKDGPEPWRPRSLQRNYAGSKTPRPPPGMGGKPEQNQSNINNTQTALRERFLQLSSSMSGQRAVITLKNGAVIEGILHIFTPFNDLSKSIANRYVVKACKRVKDASTVKGERGIEFENGCTRIVSVDEVSSVHMASINVNETLQHNRNSNDGSFKTDVEISGQKNAYGRDLVAAGSAWTSGTVGERRSPGTALGSTTSSGGLRGNIGQWDQFKANEDLFDVRATFDENLYTTELDKSSIDKQKVEEAHRLAREIETTASSNIHISEERGHVLEGDYDEEDLYSGVLKEQSLKVAVPSLGDTSTTTTDKSTDGIRAASQKMNYAAAAAKADKKSPTEDISPEIDPKELSSSTTNDDNQDTAGSSEEKNEESDRRSNSPPFTTEASSAGETKTTDATEEVAKEVKESLSINGEASSDHSHEKTPETKPLSDETETIKKKSSSKLNVNAKAFNPNAKSFVPGAMSTSAAPPDAPSVQMIDPNSGMAVHGAYAIPQMAAQPPYMQIPAHMAQPGVVPVVSTVYPNSIRYQGGSHQYHQVQPGQEENVPAPGTIPNEGSIANQANQQKGRTTQQTSAPVSQYSVAPPGAAFYGANMGMHPHPRGPNPPQVNGFNHQLGPQQITVVPGTDPYRQMYGHPAHLQQHGGVSNMTQMHVSRGNPAFIQNPSGSIGMGGSMQYTPNTFMGHGAHMEDGPSQGYRGGGGRGSGRGGGGKGGRGRGKSGGRGSGGRGYYKNQHMQQNSGNSELPDQTSAANNDSQPEVKGDTE